MEGRKEGKKEVRKARRTDGETQVKYFPLFLKKMDPILEKDKSDTREAGEQPPTKRT